MLKTNKQGTIVKISLIVSTLFFASTTQRILGMNLLLDLETKQSKFKTLDQDKIHLTRNIGNLERQVSEFIANQTNLQQGIQDLHGMRQSITQLNQVLRNLLVNAKAFDFIKNLRVQRVNTNDNNEVQQRAAELRQQYDKVNDCKQLVEGFYHDINQVGSEEVLKGLRGYQFDKFVGVVRVVKYDLQDALASLEYACLAMRDAIILMNIQPYAAKDINDKIQLVNTLIHALQDTPLIKARRKIKPLSNNTLQKIDMFVNQLVQELRVEIAELNCQIAELNQEIIKADQKVKAINSKLDDLDNTKPDASVIEHVIREDKTLEEAVKNHDSAVTGAMNMNINTAVSGVTSSMGNIVSGQGNQTNIISSGSNICSSNNGWNIQGNIFTSKSSQEENEELKKYDAGINGVFITVNKYVNENTIVGATGLYSNLNIQYDENIKHIFNKTDCKTFSLSLNGRYYPQDNVFTQGIIGFITYDGKTEYIANKPSSEISGKGYYVDFMLGGDLNSIAYNPKLTVSPIVGIRYNKFNNSSYKLFNDVNVSDAEHYILEARAGGTVKYVIDNKNISIIPEVYAFIHSNLPTNSSNIKLEYVASSNSSTVDIKPAKMHTLFGQLGGTVTIYRGPIRFGASYSAYFAEKYIAHVGSLNIKANF
uniref:Surface cell antigen B n=1 Tax=Orientia tsutsugamushi TaxID=784 RepID=A0A873QKD3_ORITS|nr:surface cell antigen B [Orientia tsutsugamushi]